MACGFWTGTPRTGRRGGPHPRRGVRARRTGRLAVILDTNAVSALLAGDPDLGRLLAESPRHHLPVIVLGEYRFGLLRSRHRQHLERLLAVLVRESDVLLVDETT